jgi:hypothetical protein
MARPKTRSKAKQLGRHLSAAAQSASLSRVGRSTGFGVPPRKAQKIVAARAAGLSIRQVCRMFNTSHNTIKAIEQNRPEIVDAATTHHALTLPPELIKRSAQAAKILCPPAQVAPLSELLSDSFFADIFGLLRAADFSAQCPGVYFLFRGNECVYVGQSKCVAARCGQHLYNSGDRPKAFDRALYIPVIESMLDTVELMAINRLRPTYNQRNSNNLYCHNATQNTI